MYIYYIQKYLGGSSMKSLFESDNNDSNTINKRSNVL